MTDSESPNSKGSTGQARHTVSPGDVLNDRAEGAAIVLEVGGLKAICRKGSYAFDAENCPVLNTAELNMFMGSLAATMHMLEGAPAEDESAPSPNDIPIHPEGECPECDNHSGITARGKFRQCQNCGFAWRVA